MDTQVNVYIQCNGTLQTGVSEGIIKNKNKFYLYEIPTILNQNIV